MKKKKDTQLAFSVIPDGEQGTVLSTALDLSTLEAHLWEAGLTQNATEVQASPGARPF
jgi:hypothetical protein